MNNRNEAIILAALLCVAGLSAVSQIWIHTSAHPAEQIQENDIISAKPQIRNYFGNLTGAEWNSEGQIIKLKFEDGTAFKLDHYEYIGSAGFNKYYNVTYQEPDQLISIQEYVEGAAFK